MNALAAVFGRGHGRERPDLAAWAALPAGARVLVVDGVVLPAGAEVAAAFPQAKVIVHTKPGGGSGGGEGLPFHERDARRLAAAAGAYDAVVLVDVLDRLLDAGPALEEAKRVLASGGYLLLVQLVAPHDFEARATWNALARLRDPRHTWTLSAKQLAQLVSSLRLRKERECNWVEAVDPLSCAPGANPDLVRRFVASLRDSGTCDFALTRVAVLLRKG